MKKGRLILLGIDGMDFEYTSRNLDKLPTIKNLSREGIVKPFKSVFPPDSIPAWITAYTGKDPSEHGILESVNYLAKGDDLLKVDISSIKGRTFWDYLGTNNKKVCVINPLLAYPVWPVNGLLVNGPVYISGEIQVSDQKLVNGIVLPESLGGLTDFPTRKNLKEFCDKIFADTEEQMEFGLRLLQNNKPDLFFQVFLTMDRIQHFLWRYCDPADPTYPGKNLFEDIIEKFYIYIDGVIGEFINALEPHDKLIVISDHGHGMRCTHCFNINEYFRRKGLLFSSATSRFSKKMLIEKLKNAVLAFMNKYNLEDYIQVVAKFVPNAKKIKKGQHITDNPKNIAYASDFTGTNPFGGIVINKDLVDDYESFRANLIEDLKKLKYNDVPVFTWVKCREHVYSGPFLQRFPDILFGMNTSLGVAWNLHTDLFTVNPTHKKISGGHKENGVIFMNTLEGCKLSEDRLEISNLFPTIMEFFDIEYNKLCDGRSFYTCD